ncbi:MAG: DUF3055 domain-containing protein [Bacillaceae bacterium]|nr:DUF3055 domain-containing protein [Bacillaceae bacterium]
MNRCDQLYDEQETLKMLFMGVATEEYRYDFGIAFTQLFFGKPLVFCMQTGCSALLSAEDFEDEMYIMEKFKLPSLSEVRTITLYLKERVPTLSFDVQY